MGPSLTLATLGADSARAESRGPPTVMKKIADGVYIFDQAYGVPGLEVGPLDD